MLWAILIGLLVGFVARLLMPGKTSGGFIVTLVLGIAGSSMANWLGHNLGFYEYGEAAGFIGSVIGAMIVIIIYRTLFGSKDS
jgi:uncharacterized membrane protein YeaQ/YmgE (transglycosylase-associated protein family)